VAENTFQVPSGQRQLFIDDHGITAVENLIRTLHQPAKKGTIIRPHAARGEQSVFSHSAPHWDSQRQRYRLLVASRWFESADGIQWVPDAQDCVLDDGAPAYHVIFDESDADPARRYKGLGMHNLVDPAKVLDERGRPLPGKKLEFALNFQVSPDGYDWRRLEQWFPSGDEQNMSYDPLEHRFIVSLKRGGKYGRSHAITTSPDFQLWSEPVLAIEADDLDQELGRLHIDEFLATPNADYLRPFPNTTDWHWQNIDIYNAAVFRYEGIFLCLPAMYHARGRRWTSHTLRFSLIQVWCSRDLYHWERVADRQTFIHWSPRGAGAFDLSKNMPPSYPVVRGDELWLYYNGNKEQSHYPETDDENAAVCLGVLRRDGFVSLEASGKEGVVITKTFVKPPGELWVNVDARTGSLKVEQLDGKGEVRATSAPIEGDHRRLQVAWKEGELGEGEPMQLRLVLNDARLYSYWITDGSS
jgi:hypothetical protein